MTMRPLPPGQQISLRASSIFLRILLDAQEGKTHTIRSLMAKFGMKSPNGMARHLDRLEMEGLISKEPSRGGTITPLQNPKRRLDLTEEFFAVREKPKKRKKGGLAKRGGNLK